MAFEVYELTSFERLLAAFRVQGGFWICSLELSQQHLSIPLLGHGRTLKDFFSAEEVSPCILWDKVFGGLV